MNGIGPTNHAYGPAASVGRDRGAAPHGRTESDDDVVGAQAVEPVGDEPGDGEANGVLQNLQAGHFRGVADVRLRINFADQILAVEPQAAGLAASQASAAFAAALVASSRSFRLAWKSTIHWSVSCLTSASISARKAVQALIASFACSAFGFPSAQSTIRSGQLQFNSLRAVRIFSSVPM